MWKGVVVLSCLLVVAAAYMSISPLEPKPDKFKNEEGCYVSFLDKVVPRNEVGSRPPREGESCEAFKCWDEHVTIMGCSPVLVSPPCTTVVQRDQPYPLCCPQPKCS